MTGGKEWIVVYSERKCVCDGEKCEVVKSAGKCTFEQLPV
jgi:hypothetical protein